MVARQTPNLKDKVRFLTLLPPKSVLPIYTTREGGTLKKFIRSIYQ
jgi:hypothetical protein